ncbi:hypothetical protein Herbaro_20190 [Herbaspirillum sp. WKF16]|uniref:glyoxalase superfamily protein n=1 Tax=Herbaspirillum sp. WKF16 TaxID=3028312 RepID=UPI0023A993B1|nr:glyoxalase superfamily protein [Herbaspirillum sp. WKF16]WDZ95770.1 hypothetical protein Herbaro_20190 [Herbaspirillum sp. WKF16]
MAIIFSDVDIKRFRLRAKHLSRSSKISHTEALDAVAHEEGFSNWALLMKSASPTEAAPVSTLRREYFRFVRTTEGMHQAMRKVRAQGPYDYTQRGSPAERATAQLANDFADGANAVDFAVDFMECLLSVPQFRIHPESLVKAEMRSWLPYFVSPQNDDAQLLVNRHYKPVGLRTPEWVEYAAYPHLKVALNSEQRLTIAHKPSAVGFLYADAIAPWQSRQNAELYLVRLRALQQFLRASPRRKVSLSSLTSTPPRSLEQIREAFAQGRFAELKPDQA